LCYFWAAAVLGCPIPLSSRVPTFYVGTWRSHGVSPWPIHEIASSIPRGFPRNDSMNNVIGSLGLTQISPFSFPRFPPFVIPEFFNRESIRQPFPVTCHREEPLGRRGDLNVASGIIFVLRFRLPRVLSATKPSQRQRWILGGIALFASARDT
jgi:hypothetical protein